MKLYQHFVLTRFNIGLYRSMAKHPARADEWLAKRLPLFEKYCVRSLRSQTQADFRWILFVDSKTPAKTLRRLDRTTEGLPVTRIIVEWPSGKRFKEADPALDVWLPQFQKIAAKECGIALQTRLDNDDMLARDFIEQTSHFFIAHGRKLNQRRRSLLIDSNHGIIRDVVNGVDHLARHGNGSPFITLVEEASGKMKSVYYDCHRQVCVDSQDVSTGIKKPMWMMVVHGSNKTNRVFPHMVQGKANLKLVKDRFDVDS